jgi:hypothetical protein
MPGETIQAEGARLRGTAIVIAFNAGLALLQLLLFLPIVAGGRSLDLVSWPGALGPLFRVDSLSLLFGVGWAAGIALTVATTSDRLQIGFPSLMTASLLIMAYAREPLVLYVGWEVAGLGLWLALQTSRQLPIIVHASGLPFLFAMILSSFAPFAPPVGGVTQPWSLPVIVAMAATVYIRSGCWPFEGWTRMVGPARLLGLYIMAAPYLLAKALVAAPWDPAGAWGLALLGTIGLLAVALISLRRGEAIGPQIASALAAIAILALGLSIGSPLTAVGAVAIMFAGALLISMWGGATGKLAGALFLLGMLPGLWLISQGALDLGYGVVAGVLLPAVAVLAMRVVPDLPIHIFSSIGRAAAVIGVVMLLLFAVYPQVFVEGLLRSAVAAMAGGVGTPASLVSDWGVGVIVRSQQETLLAALPATGIALAVFLAWAALYWLKRLAAHISPEQTKTSLE